MTWATVERLAVERLRAELRRASVRPRLPEAAWPAWAAFWELNDTRAWTERGPAAVDHAAMQAFYSLKGEPPHAPTVRLIRALDRAYCLHMTEEIARRVAQR